MRHLHVAPSLSLPPEAVTETFGVLAARGAGKSNTGAVMAEEMFKAKLPFVVVDPVRAWWGLRSSADGTGPGLPIPIFGGRHGDVPLERGGGQLVADLVVDQRLSCILDLSDFDSEAAKKQFLLDFARRLYQRNEAPLHLFLEEADDYIPQRPMGRDEPFLLRAWENIVRRGRARGIGCTLVTQRSASLNKNVLTQVQTLIPMRTTGPQDIAAVREWVRYHHQSEEILASLPALEDGEAWVWSPHFLRKTVRVRFRLRETFDSAATPKVQVDQRPPATLADVDLAGIQKRMVATIERAKQEDPRALRARIAELEREIRTKPAVSNSAPAPRKADEGLAREFKAFKASYWKMSGAATEVRRFLRQTADTFLTLGDRCEKLREHCFAMADNLEKAQRVDAEAPVPTPVEQPVARPRRATTGRGEKMPGGARRILTALAQYQESRTRAQVAVLAAYAVDGGGFANLLGMLRGKGWIEGSETLSITAAGLAALGSYEPLPTGRALLEYWLPKLGKAERGILQTLVDAYPGALTKDDVARATGYAADGGGFNNALGRLRTLELVTGRPDLRASEALFQEDGR